MLSLDTANNTIGGIGSLKSHDTKRFRLRAVSNETEIYERYFHKSVAKKVSWVQLGTATFTLIAQMTVMFILLDRYEYYSSGAYMGSGIWSSMAIILSSVMTMWACKKPSYGKLHVSMALHIISVLAQIFFVLILFCSGIPEIRRSIRSIHRGDYSEFYGYYGRYYSSGIDSSDSDDGSNGTTPHNHLDNSRRRVQPTNDEIAFGLRQLNAAFALNALMSFAGIMQILTSFLMSLKTGRAICCGRTHLEGKFLEMEAVGREEADAVVNFRVGNNNNTNRERQSQSVASTLPIVPPRSNSVGPPPYDSGLGFFSAPQSSGESN